MKKKYFLFFLLSFKILAQTPELDNTFNIKDGGKYQQNIGTDAVLLQNNKILSVFENSYTYKVILLNPDGSLDQAFNSTDSYTTREIRIFPKSDGAFMTLDRDGKLKAFNPDGTTNSFFPITILKNVTSISQIKDIIYQGDGKAIIHGGFQEVNNVFTGSCVRLNANGSIDETFKLQSGGNKLIIQSDGKYVTNRNTTISRYLADGKIDPTFKVIATIDPVRKFVTNGFETANNSTIKDIAVQTDGKVIAVGCNFVENSRIISYNIVRLNSNGTRDTGFKPIIINQDSRIQKVYLQKDNKIIIIVDNKKLIRLNTDGTIDNTFKYSNTVSLINKGELFFQGEKMIISGDFKDSQGITRAEIHRINNNGSIDLTFNPHSGPNLSFDEWDYNNQYEFVSKVLLDQKILLIGDFTTYSDNVVKNICRVNQNGEYDPTFKLDPSIGIYAENRNLDNNYTILHQNNGKILLKSSRGVSVNNISRNLIRLNNDGSLDKSFIFYDPESNIRRIKLLENGKILLLGGGGTLSRMTRLNSNGSIDTSFNCIFYHIPLEITVLADKKFLVTFMKENDNNPFEPVIKFNEDGSKDLSFKSGFSPLYNIKELSDGKLIAIMNDKLTRLNTDGSIDKTFVPYSVAKTSSNQYNNFNYYENGNIFLFFSTYSTDTTTKLTLSSEGKLLNTMIYKTSNGFEIQNCEDLLFYGYFDKIEDVNKSGLARYKTSNTVSTPNPEGEIYQSFEGGQTLKDLKVNGTDLKWYNIQTNCGINNKITKKGTNSSENFLSPETVLVDGMTYYASQSINGIESSYRLPVTVYSKTLGVKDNNLFPYLITYPNPVKDFYTISNSEEISKVEVYNLSGQLQFRNSYNNNNIKIDFTSLSSGLYLVKIFSGNKNVTIKTIKN
ncbi:T9SS type A sorting domain-containing protein [Flavobacterium ajazii]|uniref:T9SS type A sorting domain-containing protein n=1 Tax=Flavobacterium ajazii TaxID=2692318 RepID=UPI0013D78A07|nr:T9SS type A sorting domain-containing protein [Flavobacterium ajazii]